MTETILKEFRLSSGNANIHIVAENVDQALKKFIQKIEDPWAELYLGDIIQIKSEDGRFFATTKRTMERFGRNSS